MKTNSRPDPSRPAIPLMGERTPTIEMDQPLFPPKGYGPPFDVPAEFRLQPKREFMLVQPLTLRFYTDLKTAMTRVVDKVAVKDLKIYLRSSDQNVPETMRVDIITNDGDDVAFTYKLDLTDNVPMFKRMERDLLRFGKD